MNDDDYFPQKAFQTDKARGEPLGADKDIPDTAGCRGQIPDRISLFFFAFFDSYLPLLEFVVMMKIWVRSSILSHHMSRARARCGCSTTYQYINRWFESRGLPLTVSLRGWCTWFAPLYGIIERVSLGTRARNREQVS